MQIKRFSVIILGTILSGCGLWGPNYAQPNTANPEAWSSNDKLSTIGINTSADLPDTAWWRSFNDPMLNQLIEDSLKYNNNIQQAIGSVIQAQGQLEQIEFSWIPSLWVTPAYGASADWAAPEGSGTGSTATVSTTGGGNANYQFSLVPNYTINIIQQLRSQEAAKAQLMNAEYTKDAMRLTIIGQVAGGYFTLGEQNYQLDLQKQLVRDTGKLYELAQGQYKNGYISLLSLQSYLQNYQAAKAQIPVIQNNIVASENALQVLVNRNPGPIKMGSDFVKMPMNGIIPANLPSDVLKQRPDIKAAEQGLITANANIGVATSMFFPSINLTGGVGTANDSLVNLFNASNNWWSVQAKANMPVIDASQFGAIKGAKGAYYTAFYNYMQTVKTAFQQVDNGLSGHQKITDSYNEQILVYNSTITAYDLSADNFKQGLYSELQELNYKVSMENAAISLASLKLQQLQSIVSLYQALAGGYKVNDELDSKPHEYHDARDS